MNTETNFLIGLVSSQNKINNLRKYRPCFLPIFFIKELFVKHIPFC